ncbi:nucleoside hydrolase [Prescottella subtropica]|uniref:nucleoside hydrolase n=1 Tax=Prescottella subtropica TaxID=2545757 RepID=UPI0010FA6370|nr:nucleoside hydrolase [Prescottella subtropica]
MPGTHPQTDNHNRRLVLVDTDTGIDDALAILTVLHAPDTDLIGIGSVFGNCDEHQAARNALTVLAAAGRPDIPVCVGSPRPGPAPSAASPHGADGLGDRGLCPPPGQQPRSETAVEQILRISRERPGQVDLLCLAPLTNLAGALDQDPMVLERFRSVTIMGGMGVIERRDVVAEALPKFLAKGDTNTNHDPAAAARVAAAPGPVTWVGMDVTGRLQLSWAELEHMAESAPVARFVHTITGDYHAYCTSTYDADRPIYTSHDSVAATVMLTPAVICDSSTASGGVLTGEDGRASVWGHTSQRTSVSHQFVTAIDYATVQAQITQTLAAR